MSRAEVYAQVNLLAELGRRLFFDPALSASGRLACASCHDPAHAYGPPGERAVMPGGKDMRQSGLRAVPSLRYLQATPAFTEHFRDSDDEGDASVDNGPTGGLTWDGRVDRGRDQARLPLLSPLEMANDSPAAVVAAVRRSPYADLLRRAFGKRIFADPDRAFDGILQALEAYEQRYTEFYPYSSKYDACLDGKAELTAAEARGLALFNDPEKGNCAHCHLSARSNDGAPPQFTDYGLARARRAAQPGDPGERRSVLLRSRAVRPAAPRPRRPRRVLRHVQVAEPAQRRAAARLLPQRRLPHAAAGRWNSTSSATPIRRNGTRATPTARCASSTTCRRSTTPTSISSRRSIGTSAIGRGCRRRRSTTSSRSCTR